MPEQGISTQGADKLQGILAASGMLKQLQDLTDSVGSTLVGSTYGEDMGSITSSTLPNVISGAMVGAALTLTPMGIALGALAGGLMGLMTGVLKISKKADDTFRSWYGGLYEESLEESARRLSAGSALAGAAEQGRLALSGESLEGSYISLLSEVEERFSTFDTARGEGFNETRKEGLARDREGYGGALGEALEEANRAVGGSRAYLENLSADYRQEALNTVLTGAETKLEWDAGVKEELGALSEQYQAAMEAYEAGDEKAGLRVDSYLREAEILAQAQYESSDAAMELGETEEDLVEAVRENTRALDGWKPLAVLNNALSKGRGKELSILGDKPVGPAGSVDFSQATYQAEISLPAVKPVGPAGSVDFSRSSYTPETGLPMAEPVGPAGKAELSLSACSTRFSPSPLGTAGWTEGAGLFSPGYGAGYGWERSGNTGESLFQGPAGFRHLTEDSYIPSGSYAAILHEGERVLTVREARGLDAGGPRVTVQVTGNEFQVRSETDLDAVGEAIASAVERKLMAGVRG